jgi:signal transduction histidine kinase
VEPAPARKEAQIDRSRGKPDAARAVNPPAGSVLLIAVTPDAPPLREVVAWARAAALRVGVAAGSDAARERLQGDAFEVVLLDLQDAAEIEGVRGLAGNATLIVRGGDPDRVPPADEWIAGGDSAGAITRCIRGALERRRLRDELAESEARFRNTIERTPDGIVIVDHAGTVRFANPGAERMFARSAAQLVGEDFGVAVVSGETTEMDLVGDAAAEPLVAELRVSSTTWDGAAAQIISLRDITDRKRAEERTQRLQLEQAAREQAEKAGERAHFLADAAATLDASLNADTTLVSLATLIVPRIADWCLIDVLDGNRIRRVAGVHADAEKHDLIEELRERFLPQPGSQHPSVRVLGSGEPELCRDLDAAGIRRLSVDNAHAELLSRLGTRSTMTVPLEARDNRIGVMTFVCCARDFDETDLELALEIASRAAHALDNARLFEAALVANRVKSDFLAVMSHELRTPLTAILGYTDLILDGVAGEVGEKQTGYLRRIRTGASQLLQILQEILIYAEMEAGRAQARPRSIRVGELIDEVVAIIEPLVREKGLEFRALVEQREAELYTDVGKLRQIALNLLANAVKFTDHGAVTLSVALRGEELSIAVTDTGIGILPEELEEIFEPFRQMEQGRTRRAGGTGLGLSVSRQLAGLLGGELNAESTTGQGSTFTLRVPSGIPMKDPVAT